ncbi:MAG: domain S-box protein [Polaromonas sp.]|nr:domain S-box protein [Polaromonas sp.]
MNLHKRFNLDFLAGGGEMGTLMRARQWAATPLGPAQGWSRTLKSTLRLVLASQHPMFVFWGPDALQFYNDAYRETLGLERHPAALGQKAMACWPEIWDVIGPQIEQVMAGRGATWQARQRIATLRDGKQRELWWTYGCSPIEDEAGVQGVLVICTDVTQEHLDQQQLEKLQSLLDAEVRQRKQAEADLHAERRHIDAALEKTQGELAQQVFDWQQLHAMTTQLHEVSDLQVQLAVVLRKVARLLKCSQGLISLFDAETGGLVIKASLGISEAGLQELACVAVGDGACGTAFAQKRRVVIEDVRTDPLYADFLLLAQREGIRGVCSTPLFGAGGQAIGALSIYCPDRLRPDERELRLIDICTAQVALVVERARAQQAMEKERGWSREILESMDEGFVLMDRQFRILRINAAGLRITRRASAESLIGRSQWEIWPSTEELPLGAAYKRAMHERVPTSVEQEFLLEGRTFWLEAHAFPMAQGMAVFFRDITRRKQTQQALADSQKRLQQLANTIPQLAWMGQPDGWIHWYNDRWYEYTGTAPADMEGWGWQSVHHPDTLPGVMECWQHCITAGEQFQMTFPLRGADGIYRPFLTLVSPLRDAAGNITQWFGTNTDVSALQEAEQALRCSEERLQEGLLAGRMAVWSWDLATDGVEFSANAHGLFGQTWDTARSCLASVHPDDSAALHQAASQAIADQGEFRTLTRLVRPDNHETVWIDIQGKVALPAHNAPHCMRGICVDVTERKRAENELLEADRRKDEFLAMLAHELRNPLAPISTAAHVLRMKGLSEQRVRQTSEIISRQVSHMSSLVNDLLDVSRVTRGLVTLEKEPLDLKPIINSAVEQVRSLMEARHHTLTVRMPASPTYVEADGIRLVQVFSNLLNNAAKYPPQGGEIGLYAEVQGQQVRLCVSDNGMGMDAALLPHIFKLFAQGVRTPDRTQGGLGLGLSLVKSLVELHGGSVQATSGGPGLGSAFTVRLPLCNARAMPAEPSPEPRQPMAASAASRSLRLMVVDDNEDAAQSLAQVLSLAGHQVTVRYDGQSALAHARAQPPQAFILDIGLPDLDGYELARRFRADPRTSGAVLIALTGHGQAHDRFLSKAAGFDHHLVKPVNWATLEQVLGQIGQSHGAGMTR